MRQTLFLFLIAVLMTAVAPAVTSAQDKTEERVKALENRVSQLQSAVEHKAGIGAFVFLCGIFCALWAQNTGRSAWLWFFLGLLFSVITVIVLLVKNADDRKRQRRQDSAPNQAG
jgi:4-hydroxybenzoate polyprenyltransferase